MITLTLLIQLIGRNPDMDGLATYYNGPGPYTRSGELFTLDMPICAVDAMFWPEMEGKTLLIVSDDGRIASLRVADTGHLYDAGEFHRSAYSKRYVHPENPAAWGPPYRVVVDIPELAFLAVFGDSETRHVWCWVMESTE